MRDLSNRAIVPAGLVGFFVAVYGLAELGPIALAKLFGMPWDFFYRLPEMHRVRAAVVVLMAGIYGVSRVVRFHPKFSPGYLAWLETTPWTSRRPLPFGPVLPVWQDAVVVAMLAALMQWRVGMPWVMPVALAVLAYAGAAGVAAVRDNCWAWTIAMLWVAPLLALARSVGWLLAVMAVLLVLACVGLRKSLEELSRMKKATPPAVGELGWPFKRIGPEVPAVTPRGCGVGFGALVGWWIFAVGRLMLLGEPAPKWGDVLMIAAFATGTIGLFRLLKYVEGHVQPFGRLATGRLVIPGYDGVFVAPACATVAGVTVTWGLLVVGAPANVALAGGVGLALALAVEMGPTLRAWRLTGRHRVAPMLPVAKYARV